MGGGNKEVTLIDSIRNGDSQTAIKILQNSMIKNQSLKSKINQKFKHQNASCSNSSRNRSLSVDCNFNLNHDSLDTSTTPSTTTTTTNYKSGHHNQHHQTLRYRKLAELRNSAASSSTSSNSNLSNNNINNLTLRKKHTNKLFDIKSLNTNNKLITKMFQYYDENNYMPIRTKLNLNYQDDSGKSIIHEACISGSLELVKLIIDSGCKLNQLDSKGYSPLHYACLNGKLDIVSLLVQNGVDCNEPTLIGNETPLHLTIQHSSDLLSSERILLIILNNGGHLSLCISNKHHQLTPFELACEAGLTSFVHTILKYLSNKDQLQLVVNYSHKSLHLAAKNAHDDIIRLLLIYNVCDLNRVISLHEINGSALHEAARYGRLQTIKLLLEAGIDTKLRNSMDQIAVDCVIKQKVGTEIKCLIHEYSQAVLALSIQAYFSNRAGALAFELNQMIIVLERREGGDWRGFILDKSNYTVKYGYFPAANVKLIGPVSDYESQTTQSNQSNSPTSASSLSSSSSSTISSPCSLSLANLQLQPSAAILNVTSLMRSGMNDSQIVFNWLKSCQLEQYYENFVKSGYDLLTIARGTTPADLCAIGISNPLHRQILKQNMQRLDTKDLEEKLNTLLIGVASIEELLKLIHLEQYLQAVNDLKLFANVNDFANTVNWEDLEEIGFKLGHQKKLMHVLKCLKEVLKKKQSEPLKRIEQSETNHSNGMTKSLENLNLSNLKLSKETAILNSPPKKAPEPPKRIDSIRPNVPPLPPRLTSCLTMSTYATLPRNRKPANTESNLTSDKHIASSSASSSSNKPQNSILSVFNPNNTLKSLKTSSPLAVSTKNNLMINSTEPSVLNDIDNMLFDLNKQLDDMLGYEKFFE